MAHATQRVGASAYALRHGRLGGGGGGRHDTVLERQDMATCALPGRGLCVLAGLCVHTVHLTSF